MKSDLILDKKPKRGFLPDHAPLKSVRSDSQSRYLTDLSAEVPKLLLTSSLPQVIESLPGSFFNFSEMIRNCLLYTSPSPRDKRQSRMPSSA